MLFISYKSLARLTFRLSPAAPVDRPFPDENTVAEMYCNEAYTVDNESVEDWTSSLQMLLTFAAIFSAVLITLIMDSKMLLKQDSTDVLIDAVIFLMNDLANGTHRPYEPPKFQPSKQSVLINCFFFASLCLSIATALAAVLAMQWVTDYGAVTRRAGSTPEERVKRRHFRYQGGQDWKMDAIIGALPIALHLSVLLFFVGLIVWMWDVHHSIFAVVTVCGAVAALFYALTTVLAILYPSCPYRTPLAGWIYTIFHLLVTILPRLAWFTRPREESGQKTAKMEEGNEKSGQDASWIHHLKSGLHSRFAQASLSLRDDVYVKSTDSQLMVNALIWLSNHISISPDVFHRLMILINGFASVMGKSVDPSIGSNVPWKNILQALGVIYKSFVQTPDLDKDRFTEFARQTHCLSQPGLTEIFVSILSDEEPKADNPGFPAQLLFAWIQSTSSHTSDALRELRFSDEVIIREIVDRISSTPQELIETWYSLLNNEAKTCQHILSRLLDDFNRSGGKGERMNTALYIISTGSLPWGCQVSFKNAWWGPVSSSPLIRRLQVAYWVDGLIDHPQKEVVLAGLCKFKEGWGTAILFTQTKLPDEEEQELKGPGLELIARRWTQPEEMLYHILTTFDQMIINAENEQGSTLRQNMENWVLTMLCEDLLDTHIQFSTAYLSDATRTLELETLLGLSNPLLRLIASATLGINLDQKRFSELNEVGTISARIGMICFKDPPPTTGDYTTIWQIRLQLWIHCTFDIPANFVYSILINLDALVSDDIGLLVWLTPRLISQTRIEQEIQSSRLGISHANDFLLTILHIDHSYGWQSTDPRLLSYIPDILTGNAGSMDANSPRACIEYFTSVCAELSAEPARLIRLLIELIRADINHSPQDRRPMTLLGLLVHAKTHLSSKELREFSPSCRRLVRYIKESYKQFEDCWDIDSDDVRSHYQMVDRKELKATCEEVVALLNPSGPWDGEEKDVSWPRHLLRPTGTKEKPFEEDLEQEIEAHSVDGDGNDERDGITQNRPDTENEVGSVVGEEDINEEK
ncbi:hypothetical protein FRC17_004603 [Serendipita sp. 399]|nr:hypothetical protein FRC17_004603 [Serendipita sp. 399]